MGLKIARRYCVACEKHVLAQRQTPNHILHLLLSIITGGLWLIVWLLVVFFSSSAWLCPSCGGRTELMKMTKAGAKASHVVQLLVAAGVFGAIYYALG